MQLSPTTWNNYSCPKFLLPPQGASQSPFNCVYFTVCGSRSELSSSTLLVPEPMASLMSSELESIPSPSREPRGSPGGPGVPEAFCTLPLRGLYQSGWDN